MSTLNLNLLKEKLLTNGIQGSPFERIELGTIKRTDLGEVHSANGRTFYQIDDLRILARPAVFNKEIVTIAVIKATRAFGKMQEGQCFAVAE